ncbi:hypothetical protein BBF96_11185 [Anoxybacter fermentans]|uniref:Flagellar biosynthesis protein FlgN n=1 Tax=Anoxybacter fermentans TaxID=1323375 RepID=A0A3Q9HT73_9FIRM|nr:flagellar protein FlgN [Anoxybacter fermentans]AZR73903.1 hypothetical protein BBF96_11185 [Anoxybacter fermentans]
MDYLNELIRVLNEEKKLYTKLTDLAHDKQQVIIANDVEKLADYLREEQDLIDKIEGIEKKRRQVVIGLCSELDIPDKELSFSKLRDFLDEGSRIKLDQLRTSLLKILEELHQTNETNRVLIEEALKINDFTIRILTQAVSPSSSTYTRAGVEENKSQHLIDKRV